MITVYHSKYDDRYGTEGEVRVGWASWDEGDHTYASVKWAFKNAKDGKVSRASPEVPIDVLVVMVREVLKRSDFFPDEDKRAVEELKSLLSEHMKGEKA